MIAHVLVLVHDLETSSVICDHLAEEGYRCTTAESLDEAEAVLARMTVDLVIADVGPSDEAAAYGLARLGERAGVPAMAIVDEAVSLGEGGSLRVLKRPLRVSDLLANVAELIEQRAGADETAAPQHRRPA